MGKLKAREVTIFPEKFRSLNSLSTMHETHIKLNKKLTRDIKVWIKTTILPEFKVKDIF